MARAPAPLTTSLLPHSPFPLLPLPEAITTFDGPDCVCPPQSPPPSSAARRLLFPPGYLATRLPNHVRGAPAVITFTRLRRLPPCATFLFCDRTLAPFPAFLSSLFILDVPSVEHFPRTFPRSLSGPVPCQAYQLLAVSPAASHTETPVGNPATPFHPLPHFADPKSASRPN